MNTMKIIKKLLALLPLWALLPLSPTPACAQTDSYYATDTTCGCDILYIDSIQTTRDGNLYGFRRYDGRVLVPNIYPYVGNFSNGYCKVWAYDTLAPFNPNASEPPLLAGLIDTSGREVVPCKYTTVDFPSDGLVLVFLDSLFGYTDLNGTPVIPPQYRHALPFSDHRAAVAVTIDSFFLFYTYIDPHNRQLLPAIYEQAAPFSDGYAAVMRYSRWGVIDRDGNEIVPFAFENMTPIDSRTVFAGDEQGMALFVLPPLSPRKQIAPSTPFIYYPVTGVTENRIAVMRDEKQGFLDLNGDEIIPCTFDEVGRFRFGRTMARIGDLYGIIDTLGYTILPIEYTDNHRFGQKYAYYDSLALVEKNGKMGFVDLDGHFVVPLTLEGAYHFSQGLAAVRHGGFWGYINTKGDIYLPIVFNQASPFQSNRAEVNYQGHRLKIDTQGRCVVNCNGIISFR